MYLNQTTQNNDISLFLMNLSNCYNMASQTYQNMYLLISKYVYIDIKICIY